MLLTHSISYRLRCKDLDHRIQLAIYCSIQVVRGLYSSMDCYVSCSHRRLVLYDTGMPFAEKVSFLYKFHYVTCFENVAWKSFLLTLAFSTSMAPYFPFSSQPRYVQPTTTRKCQCGARKFLFHRTVASLWNNAHEEVGLSIFWDGRAWYVW